MIKKTIAIYFSDPGEMDYPFNDEYYFEEYRRLMNQVTSSNIHIHIVRADSYEGNGVFSHGWHFEDNTLVESDGKVQADLIFNRDDKNTIPHITDCNIINKSEFDELCLDKLKTAQAFPEQSPHTDIAHSYEEVLHTVDTWNIRETDFIVLKKNFETNGRGIHIIPKNQIVESLYDEWADILVQQFIDSSVGIAGIVKGAHDFRVNVVDGTIQEAFVREPEEGSLLANISMGGTGFSIDIADIPKHILDMVHPIIESVSLFTPALFAADVVNSKDGYKLIELNSRPGLSTPDSSSRYKEYNASVATMLINAVQHT